MADDLTAARIRREVARRQHPMSSWLGGLGSTEVYHAVAMTHVLGDGDDIMVGARLPGGEELTALVYVDHNLGTVVKDAFVVDQPVGDLVALMRRTADDPDTSLTDLDLAEARAKIDEAVEVGVRMWPPLESDTWPMCRPLVEWLAGLMPAGGAGWQRTEWTDSDRERLAADFFASAHAAGLDDAERRSLLDSLLWFGTDYANGDPLRWSSVTVELLLVDWIPRKLIADVAYLSAAPGLLRAYVAYAHDRVGISANHTRDTLAAIDHYEPEYQQTIRSPRLQGPQALLAAAGLLAGDGFDPDGDDLLSYEEIMLDSLRRAVGGAQALDTLDDEPLPDEPFAWSRLPADIHDRVGEVLVLVDGCCAELLDDECRTACRRLLADVAEGDPAVFRRAGAARTAAAALCWIIGKANLLVGWDTGLEVRELAAYFGVSGSPGQRASTLLKAAGKDPYQYGGMDLGSPRYLVSARRAAILAQRDRYLRADG